MCSNIDYNIAGKDEEEAPYLPISHDAKKDDHIHNEDGNLFLNHKLGTYVKTEFGWLFVRSQDIVPGIGKYSNLFIFRLSEL